jgi:hypothetical protein
LLATLLSFSGGWFDETDRRDRIFALLGFVEGQLCYQGFKADYNETMPEVFIKFAKYLFGELRSVEFLVSTYPRDLDGLPNGIPSWVPTWAGKVQFMTNPSNLNSLLQGESTLSSVDISFPGDGLTLRTEGTLVSRVAFVGSGCPGFRDLSPASLHKILETWEEQILNSTLVRKRYARSENIAEIWKRTLMHRLPSLGELDLPVVTTEDAPIPLPKPIGDQHRIFELFMDPNLLSEDDKKRFTSGDEIVGYLHHLANQLSGDTPFVTTGGDIGLTRSGCSVELKQDDVVCLIQGCLTPILLRPEESHFTLLGSCYVDRYLGPNVQKELLAENPQIPIDIR